MLVDAAKYGDVEIPVFCYEPKLGQPVGACRMCLVEIEGIPKLQTALLDAGQGRHGRLHADRARARRAARGGRVPARQPPARLPGVRQGRRVPAAGHHLRLGPGHVALHRAQAPLPQAARALAADRDRPRALHPLLPLRALLAGDLRGLPADPARARRAHLRRDVRRDAPTSAPFSGNIIELCPVGALTSPPTASARARGTSRARAPSARCARRQCNVDADGARRARGCACWRATTTRSTTAGCATRAASRYQSIHVDERIVEPLVRDGGPTCARRRGSRRWRRRRARLAKAGARGGGDRRRRDHQRGGLPARAPVARGARLAAPRLARRAASSGSTWRARWPTRRCRPRCPTSSGAHAVLVLDCDPIDDAPILDLRLRKGVRRNGVRLAVASRAARRARPQRRS